KVRARGADTSTHRLLSHLWTGSFGPDADDGITVPEPVGVLADLQMVVQRRVPGEALTCLLEGSRGYPLARRAAEAIAKLHRQAVPAHRQHSVDDEIRILRERLVMVADSLPHWQTRITALLDGCERIAASLHDAPSSGIHRDFYPDQILVDGDRLYLLDLDLYSNGDPALDVGNFMAHLDEYSLRRFADTERLADRKSAFVERYLELSTRTTRGAIDAYAALSLARHIAISQQFSERRPLTGALLDLCEERVLRLLCVGRH
ncbi:MAG: phosphotransferase, partial [Acidobacteria bacterium]|nr:phosphotransferase [Acidobacteriota bacterium]